PTARRQERREKGRPAQAFPLHATRLRAYNTVLKVPLASSFYVRTARERPPGEGPEGPTYDQPGRPARVQGRRPADRAREGGRSSRPTPTGSQGGAVRRDRSPTCRSPSSPDKAGPAGARARRRARALSTWTLRSSHEIELGRPDCRSAAGESAQPPPAPVPHR